MSTSSSSTIESKTASEQSVIFALPMLKPDDASIEQYNALVKTCGRDDCYVLAHYPEKAKARWQKFASLKDMEHGCDFIIVSTIRIQDNLTFLVKRSAADVSKMAMSSLSKRRAINSHLRLPSDNITFSSDVWFKFRPKHVCKNEAPVKEDQKKEQEEKETVMSHDQDDYDQDYDPDYDEVCEQEEEQEEVEQEEMHELKSAASSNNVKIVFEDAYQLFCSKLSEPVTDFMAAFTDLEMRNVRDEYAPFVEEESSSCTVVKGKPSTTMPKSLHRPKESDNGHYALFVYTPTLPHTPQQIKYNHEVNSVKQQIGGVVFGILLNEENEQEWKKYGSFALAAADEKCFFVRITNIGDSRYSDWVKVASSETLKFSETQRQYLADALCLSGQTLVEGDSVWLEISRNVGDYATRFYTAWCHSALTKQPVVEKVQPVHNPVHADRFVFYNSATTPAVPKSFTDCFAGLVDCHGVKVWKNFKTFNSAADTNCVVVVDKQNDVWVSVSSEKVKFFSERQKSELTFLLRNHWIGSVDKLNGTLFLCTKPSLDDNGCPINTVTMFSGVVFYSKK